MLIHPIDFRYGTPEMKHIWCEENRFSCIVSAEAALAKALGDAGLIPKSDAETIQEKAGLAKLSRAKEIEAEIGHEVMGAVKAVSEVCGDAGRFVHFGATSNDILDTATGMQIQQAAGVLAEKLAALRSSLLCRAEETKYLV